MEKNICFHQICALMKCPHCAIRFFEEWNHETVAENPTSVWITKSTRCPECGKHTIYLIEQLSGHKTLQEYMVQPLNESRPLPQEIPEKFAKPFREAVSVLPFSAAASAALSRRCLQNLLREEANVQQSNLADEIQEVIDSNTLPSDLAQSIDNIRTVGNFAAHPIKSTNTGAVIEVEQNEADWLLIVLEELFDHYLVKPIMRKRKNDELDKKLKNAGKRT